MEIQNKAALNEEVQNNVARRYTFQEVIDMLNSMSDKYVYKVYDTCLEQGKHRWGRGKKSRFQKSLVDGELKYFAYIKFYLDDGEKYAIVAGKSGSLNVNKSSGCDLSFSLNNKHGKARRWLNTNHKEWCQTEIIVVTRKEEVEDNKENEKIAFEIESDLKKCFDLLGS